MNIIRIFVKEQNFHPNKQIIIIDQDFDYLFKVMRSKVGEQILIFNNLEDEWQASIISINKKSALIELIAKNRSYYQSPNITLAFALVKNIQNGFIATKATEMGVRKFIPLITQHSVVDKINEEKFKAHIKEAAEQSRRLDLAELMTAQKLSNFLANSEIKDKILILCDESHQGSKASELLPKIAENKNEKQEVIILIGPEGGFSKEEFIFMKNLPNLYSLSLGPRILRADTAIVAALALVQEFLGDF
jgi:16S rRNA (uracil1498-N3)-methyltransferase